MAANQFWPNSTERKSYLENYPSPLGHFKSIFIIQNIHPLLENQVSQIAAKYYSKMNIGFSHGIFISDTRLVLFLDCKVNDSIVGKWRIKANVKFTINDFNDRVESIIYDCGDVWFDNDMHLIRRDTVITANDLLNTNFGFVNGTRMIMGTDIRILEVEGFYQPAVWNHRVPPINPDNRFVFAYPHENLYCSKEIMDIHCEMNGDKKVSAIGQLIFPLASRGPLEEFLDAVHGFPIPLYGRGGLRDFLDIAEHFKMRGVAQRVATAAIHDAGLKEVTYEFLMHAVRYDLRRVIHYWLSSDRAIYKRDVVDLGVHRMSGETMKAIVKRILETGWEK